MADEKATFNYEIVETLGSLSESNKGWKKVVNYISWNGKEPKYDIREWAPDGEKMGKGVTLSKEEMANLKALLNKIDLDGSYRIKFPLFCNASVAIERKYIIDSDI